MKKTHSIKQRSPRTVAAWGISLAAVLASIYFIEIVGNKAAPLCWFERMLMFGLFLNLSVALYRNDDQVKYYALPFLVLGIAGAAYQQLVHWNIINLSLQPCSESYVCTTKFFELFGFITQATLCLAAFVGIGVLLWLRKK